jgi:hypothetical protein
MQAIALNVEHKHPHSVQVKVMGGESANALCRISNDVFAKRIADTITQNKLFSEVKQAQPTEYILNVQITNIEPPVNVYSMTVYIDTAWELIKVETGKPAMREAIASSATANVGDSFFGGPDRLNVAVSRMERDNIEKGLTKITRLSL